MDSVVPPPPPPPLPALIKGKFCDPLEVKEIPISPTLTKTTSSEEIDSSHSISTTGSPEYGKNQYRLKRELPASLRNAAKIVEDSLKARMGCTISTENVNRVSSKDHSLRNRKPSIPKRPPPKHYPPERISIEEVSNVNNITELKDQETDETSSSDQTHDNQLSYRLIADGTRSVSSLTSTNSLRLRNNLTTHLTNTFEPVRFSQLNLTDDVFVDMQLVVLNSCLPIAFTDARLNFLYHFHQTMYSIHLYYHKKVKSYPKDDVLTIIERNLISHRHYHYAAKICPSAPMTFFVLDKTFSFRRRKVKENKFNLPFIIPDMAFNSDAMQRILLALHTEFESLYKLTFNQDIQLPFHCPS